MNAKILPFGKREALIGGGGINPLLALLYMRDRLKG